MPKQRTKQKKTQRADEKQKALPISIESAEKSFISIANSSDIPSGCFHCGANEHTMNCCPVRAKGIQARNRWLRKVGKRRPRRKQGTIHNNRTADDLQTVNKTNFDEIMSTLTSRTQK
eukprot:732318_1